jgi:hypothetical protein
MLGRTHGRTQAKLLSGRRCGKGDGASEALMLHQHAPTQQTASTLNPQP